MSIVDLIGQFPQWHLWRTTNWYCATRRRALDDREYAAGLDRTLIADSLAELVAALRDQEARAAATRRRNPRPRFPTDG